LTRAWLAAWMIWLALLAGSVRPLHAQSGDEDARRAAKEHFTKGLDHARAGRWDAALAEFLASRDLFPTQVALKNAAIALGELGRYAEALAVQRELLERFGASMSPEEKKAIEDARAAFAGRVGRVVITANPAGATVVVDGRDRGTTPLASAIELDAGTHTVRIWKVGYETYETQVSVAGGQSKSVVKELVPLRAAGILVVTEVEGRPADVVVDGVVVGPAPWTGTLAPGPHVVLLRGKGDLGTAPSTAIVTNGETKSLRLRIVKLDASLRIEPVPSNAQVFVDKVAVGSGVWEGRLQSGPHDLEVAADGFIAFRGRIVLPVGGTHKKVALERDLSNPMWQAGFVPHVYLEALGGLAWAPTFGGDADAACSDQGGDCSSPLGFLAGARGGYELAEGFGLELFLGAFYLRGSTRRRVVASGENGFDWTSDDYEDSTTLFGPAAAVSASARFFETTPLTFRVWAGAARLNASFDNGGTFTGQVVYAPPGGPTETATSVQRASVPERSERIWVPFVGPEARFGYRFSKLLSVDAGVLVLFAFPPATPRTGLTDVSRGDGDRKVAMADATLPSGNLARGGLLGLPREDGFGTLVTVVPNVALRIDL
jgi:hypothetical protein